MQALHTNVSNTLASVYRNIVSYSECAVYIVRVCTALSFNLPQNQFFRPLIAEELLKLILDQTGFEPLQLSNQRDEIFVHRSHGVQLLHRENIPARQKKKTLLYEIEMKDCLTEWG